MKNRRHSRHAFTLVEALMLMVIMSIVGVGIGLGLQGATKLPEATDRAMAVSTELNSEIEGWKAAAWGTSPWPSSLPYSKTDTVTINAEGQSLSYSRTVSIQTWDPTNLAANTSPQSNFVRVSVTINGQTLLCYLTNPN